MANGQTISVPYKGKKIQLYNVPLEVLQAEDKSELKRFVQAVGEQGKSEASYDTGILAMRQSEARPADTPTSLSGTPDYQSTPPQKTGVLSKIFGQNPVEDLKQGAASTLRGAVPLTSLQIVTDPITAGANFALKKFGSDKQFMTLADAQQNYLTSLGVPESETKQEKFVEDLSTSVLSAMSGIGLGSILKSGGNIIPSISKEIGKQIAANPNAQLVGSVTSTYGAEGADKLADVLEADDGQRFIMNLVGSVLGDIVGTKMAKPLDSLSQAKVTPMAKSSQDALEVTKPYGELTTSELTPPKTQKGTTLQRMGEGVPGGAGELQFARQQERLKNVRNLMDDFDIDVDDLGNTPKFSEEIMEDFLKVRNEKLTTNVNAKQDVIQRLSGSKVPVDNAKAFLDDALADVQKRDTAMSRKLANKIVEWQGALEGKDLDTLEKTRKDLLDELATSGNEDIAKQGSIILNDAYKEVVNDMGEYIKDNGTPQDFNQWKASNKELSLMASEFKDKALFRLLEEGKKNPENIRVEDIDKLLFSRNKSDVSKLMSRLSSKGRETAKTALISKFAEEANPADLSPARFAKSMQKYADNIGVVFNKQDVKKLEGLKKYLDMTKRAEEFTRGSRGYSGLPTGDIPGTGTAISMGVRGNPLLGLLSSAAGTMGIGKIAQYYESPKIRNLMAQMAEVKPDSTAATEIAKRINRVIATMSAREDNRETGQTYQIQ